MIRFLLAGVLVCSASSVAVYAADEKPANELVGTWKLDLSQNSELKGAQDRPNDVTLVYEADNWKLTIINDGGSQEIVGGYFADATQTPKLLDVTVRGDADTTQIFAIYELVDNKLTVAMRPDGTRPADFNGTVADGLVKVSFIRQKDE